MRKSGEERRKRIVELLEKATGPISGNDLAGRLGVSRQVIVTDISLLRASDPNIVSTNAGYVLMKSSLNRRIFKVSHTDEQVEEELTLIVDCGGSVTDVFVEHKVYGTICAPLNISSKRDIQNFMDDLKGGVSTPLKNITHGYHYHTVEARNEVILDEIEELLREKGFLIETQNSKVRYSPKSYNNV